jgi:hypothetical protein
MWNQDFGRFGMAVNPGPQNFRFIVIQLNCGTSRTELKHLAIRLHIYEWVYVDLATAQARYQEAKRAYNTNKANAANWRDDHTEALVEARALESGRTIELEKKLLYGKEKARRLGAVSKQIRQKGTSLSY